MRSSSCFGRHCFRNGNHVLFNYAVGVCHGDELDLERMRQITGFDCGYTLAPGELAVRVHRADPLYLDGVKEGTVYGTYGDLSPQMIRHHAALKSYPESFQITPRFWIKSGGEILGETLDYGETPRGGLAIAPRDGWTSILSVAPLLPREALRSIARAAGCHVYTDFPGQVFHCEGYLGMYFHETGPCVFKLPRARSGFGCFRKAPSRRQCERVHDRRQGEYHGPLQDLITSNQHEHTLRSEARPFQRRRPVLHHHAVKTPHGWNQYLFNNEYLASVDINAHGTSFYKRPDGTRTNLILDGSMPRRVYVRDQVSGRRSWACRVSTGAR